MHVVLDVDGEHESAIVEPDRELLVRVYKDVHQQGRGHLRVLTRYERGELVVVVYEYRPGYGAIECAVVRLS